MMKKILLIVSLLFLSVGFSQQIIPVVETYENGNIESITYHKKSRTGIEKVKYEQYYENGQKKSEGKFEDDKKDGLWKDYYENGQLQEEGHYKEGKYEGLWRRYFDNGILSIKGNYKNDKQEGFWKSYYDNGQLKYEWNYKEGELISQKCWDEDGNEKECD